MPVCPYCFKDAVLVGGDVIYPHRKDLHNIKMWQCEPCGAYVGVHKNTPDHKPLGTLADAPTRKARIAAHAAFDPFWKKKLTTRGKAYRWLMRVMNMTADECHISMMNVEQCQRVIAACAAKRRHLQRQK